MNRVSGRTEAFTHSEHWRQSIYTICLSKVKLCKVMNRYPVVLKLSHIVNIDGKVVIQFVCLKLNCVRL